MPAAFQDYYTTLGVERGATEDAIKKAFRKLARQYHPDVAAEKDKATAEEKFKEINEAYEVLSDPEKRRQYDQLGAAWQQAEGDGYEGPPPRGGSGYSYRQGSGQGPGSGQDFHFSGTGFSDFFEQYFGGGARYGGFSADDGAGYDFGGAAASSSRPRRGHDIEGDILVTLAEAMHGTVRPLSLQTVNRATGQVETREFQVRIPPGATDGRRIRVPEHGEPGQGGAPAGDLFLRVRHAAHPDFKSDGADVLRDLDIAPWEAVLGAETSVATLDGTIKLRIPPGAENGQKLRVRSRGLPKGKTGERGDFYVVLNVQLPSELSAEERQLWEKLREASTFHPRQRRSNS